MFSGFMCVSYLHTFPENVKNEILDYFFFTFYFKDLGIKEVELWTDCFLKAKFTCLTFVKGHCHNVGFYSYEKPNG